MLSTRGRRVAMVRLRLENSPDMDRLAERFGDAVSFIWANEPENLLFALKTALDAGNSLALQCDRSEFSAKTEAFEFLGARRIFPFTIYHLAILYGRPVMFCFGLPDGNDGTRVIANPLYQPHGATRDENFTRAREHFQGVLARLEALVRQHPYLWFNFHPLNAIAAPATAAVPETGAQNMGPRAPVANGTAQSAMPTSNAGTELER
jgi:predicted LPLAT superfamily acyltransferase